MPDAKISDSAAVAIPNAAAELAVNDGGVNKKLTLAQVRDFGRYMLRTDAARNLTSSTAEQKLFADPANGRLTLPVGLYEFDAVIQLTGMSATSGNAAFDPVGAGTAVTAAWLYAHMGLDNTAPATAAAISGGFSVGQQTAAAIVLAATGTGLGALVRGTFEVTTAGTIIPSVTLLTAAAAAVAVGTYFRAQRISDSTSLVSIGPAD